MSRHIPSDCAASSWPASTEIIPPRKISAMYAASLSPNPRRGGHKARDHRHRVRWGNSSPEGHAERHVGKIAALNSQKRSWTITGVPRKNQM